jgi:protein-arginine kinase activator protein McsA
MICNQCGAETTICRTKVLPKSVIRFRKCHHCKVDHEFKTVEYRHAPVITGEKNHNAVWTDDDIQVIRWQLKHGVPTRAIAKTFGMSISYISTIKTGYVRKDLTYKSPLSHLSK